MELSRKANKEKVRATKEVREFKSNQFNKLIGGVFLGYAITIIVFVAYALLLTYTDMSEKYLQLVVTVTTIVAVVTAGFDASRGARHKGWLWGIAAGLCYALIMCLMGSIVSAEFVVDGRTVTIIILSIAGGGLGGVLGINSKK